MPKVQKKESSILTLPIKSSASAMPKATDLITPSGMGVIQELTPITLGRSDWFPCTKKGTLNHHVALSVA